MALVMVALVLVVIVLVEINVKVHLKVCTFSEKSLPILKQND